MQTNEKKLRIENLKRNIDYFNAEKERHLHYASIFESKAKKAKEELAELTGQELDKGDYIGTPNITLPKLEWNDLNESHVNDLIYRVFKDGHSDLVDCAFTECYWQGSIMARASIEAKKKECETHYRANYESLMDGTYNGN